MADVACFCGCEFSFEGAARVCPRCGEVASVTGDRATEAAAYDDESDDTLLYVKDIWQTGEPARTWAEFDEADALSGNEALAVRAARLDR